MQKFLLNRIFLLTLFRFRTEYNAFLSKPISLIGKLKFGEKRGSIEFKSNFRNWKNSDIDGLLKWIRNYKILRAIQKILDDQNCLENKDFLKK